jgi:hypothetical protein
VEKKKILVEKMKENISIKLDATNYIDEKAKDALRD